MGGALVDLHLALGNTVQACAVAEARAQQEQAAGNYKASTGGERLQGTVRRAGLAGQGMLAE